MFRLITYDDGYDPARVLNVTKQLLNQERVIALLGPIGTPAVCL